MVNFVSNFGNVWSVDTYTKLSVKSGHSLGASSIQKMHPVDIEAPSVWSPVCDWILTFTCARVIGELVASRTGAVEAHLKVDTRVAAHPGGLLTLVPNCKRPTTSLQARNYVWPQNKNCILTPRHETLKFSLRLVYNKHFLKLTLMFRDNYHNRIINIG